MLNILPFSTFFGPFSSCVSEKNEEEKDQHDGLELRGKGNEGTCYYKAVYNRSNRWWCVFRYPKRIIKHKVRMGPNNRLVFGFLIIGWDMKLGSGFSIHTKCVCLISTSFVF